MVTFSGPSVGTLDTSALPSVTYLAPADYIGPDGFTYTVTDRGDPDGCTAAPCSGALQAQARVTLDVSENSIKGRVHNDANANGSPDEGEIGMAGVTVRLTAPDGSPVAEQVNGEDGAYAFNSLLPGTYQVRKEWRVSRAEMMRFVEGNGTKTPPVTAPAKTEAAATLINKGGVLVVKTEPLADLTDIVKLTRSCLRWKDSAGSEAFAASLPPTRPPLPPPSLRVAHSAPQDAPDNDGHCEERVLRVRSLPVARSSLRFAWEKEIASLRSQ